MQNVYLAVLLNLTLSAMLTGLIWTIQIVHYPGFLGVGVEKFIAYQHNHMRTISYVVIPLMVAELSRSFMATASSPRQSIPYYISGYSYGIGYLVEYALYLFAFTR